MGLERREAEGLDELAAPPPDQNPEKNEVHRQNSLELECRRDKIEDQTEAVTPSDRWEAEGLDELAAPPPDQNPEGNEVYRQNSLESERRREDIENRTEAVASTPTPSFKQKFLPVLYAVSYLIFFSILGTLARLGIVALTTYPGAPNANPILWANVSGSLIIGYLREDRLLFRSQWKQALRDAEKKAEEEAKKSELSNEGKGDQEGDESQEQARQLFSASKVTVHAYVGMSVGFCGSFTSFADIIRDAFLALSNDFNTARISTLTTEDVAKVRPAGYSVLAVIGIVWLQAAMSTAALQLGAHIATALEEFSDRLPELEYEFEAAMDKAMVVLGWGAWLGTVMLAIWPPHEAWRGQAVFAIVVAPLGCLLRFYLALLLNRRISSFPLGTFTANVLGTCILGMILDLQYSRLGGNLGCQILQGVGDGFCGALTTISTWVLELKALRLVHAYIYAATSIGVSFAFILTIMGSLRWTEGFRDPVCVA
ncbi:hypothetical protein LTR15_010683 [Elasticomyces elasticus]|nr:hypothetical protein LTR15_010683 [Elasticomyces elasticus]